MNTRANNFVMAHDNLVPVIKKINEITRAGSGVDLASAMRVLDVTSNGQVSKDDFINTVFDTVKGVKPSDLMQLVTAFSEND